MEVVYLLTAEIPSEFHCAQITTFHMQHVTQHLRKAFVIILTLIGIVSFGQENKLDQNENGMNSIEPNELDSLYVRALNSRIDLILGSGWNYVEMSGYGKRIAELDVSDRIKFLTNEELIDLSIKKKKRLT